jgi:chromosome segregation ATPase
MSRYIKALEAIKIAKKSQDEKVKEYNTELVYLKQAKDKAKEIEEDMKKTQGRIAASQDRVTKIGQDLQPVEARLEELGGTMSAFFEREKEIESVNAQRVQLERNRDELRCSIGTIYEDSLERLQTKHNDLNTELQHDREQQKRYSDQLQSLEEESHIITAERNKLFQEHGRLQQEYQAHKQAEQERDKEIRRLAKYTGVECK